MSTINLEDTCMHAVEVVALAATYIREQLGSVSDDQIEEKGLHDLVSHVDTTSEKMLVDGLSPLIPNATFLTEEGMTVIMDGDYKWIIDPLDGTTNFLHGLPCFSISVALEYKGNYQIGIVHEVNHNECFYAWKGGGAWMNGKSISPRSEGDLDKCLLATGFPFHDFSRMKSYLKVLEVFMRRTRGLRRFGSAAVDLAYVACGRFDAYFEYRLNPWDIAAGAFIVQEAGGRVSDFDGGDQFKTGIEIVASSEALYPQMLQIIENSFKE